MTHPCDSVLIDGVFRTFHYQASDTTTESVATWFFSEQFEQFYRNNASNLDILIPLGSVPIIFGGRDETREAWELRARQENRGRWDFSRTSWKSLLVRTEATDVLKKWG